MPAVFLVFSDRHDVARAAAKGGLERAFGDGLELIEVASVDEFFLAPSRASCDLLVLICPELSEFELALNGASPEAGVSYPVVALGEGIVSSGLTVIPPEDWHAPLLAQVFRGALQTHSLIRENECLRGDLMTFARRVSHDLRANLSGILATAELLKDILSEHSEEDAALTMPLFDCTQAVLKLIERTSQVARATAEHRLKEEVDMAQAVWAGRQSAEQAAVKSRIQMNEPEDWPQVHGVLAWLEVVWANLLQLAVQRSKSGASVELHWEEKEHEFLFTVRDHGPDLTLEQCAALMWPFDKLHQGHSTNCLLYTSPSPRD